MVNGNDLRIRFRQVLAGFEEFRPEAWVMEYRYQLEEVRHDLERCALCQGECRTVLYVPGGPRLYFGLDRAAIENSGQNKPLFKAFLCPGVVERKRQIAEYWGGHDRGCM